jgi:biotin synthase
VIARQDRLATLAHVRDAGISVCAGGIIGLGEGEKDRVGLLHQARDLPVASLAPSWSS